MQQTSGKRWRSRRLHWGIAGSACKLTIYFDPLLSLLLSNVHVWLTSAFSLSYRRCSGAGTRGGWRRPYSGVFRNLKRWRPGRLGVHFRCTFSKVFKFQHIFFTLNISTNNFFTSGGGPLNTSLTPSVPRFFQRGDVSPTILLKSTWKKAYSFIVVYCV